MITITSNQLPLWDFEQARRRAIWRNLFSRLTGTCNKLRSLNQIRQVLLFEGQHYRGLQAVSLNKIVGSEGRYHEFDRAFFPRHSRTRDRWVRIDLAYYKQMPLPPIELVKVSEMYFVRDGNHRVSVARARGQEFIEAYVTELDVSIPVELPKMC